MISVAVPALLRVATPAPLRTAVAVARTVIAVLRVIIAAARRTATTKMTRGIPEEGRTAIAVVLDETVIRVFVGQCVE